MSDPDDTTGAAEPESEVRAKPKRKKKKRKKRAPEPQPRSAAPRAVDRPAFLQTFPDHPDLDRLVVAFEKGDYRTVREGAPELADKTDDPRVRDAALELWRRIEPDPLIRYMLFASIGLLVFLVIYFYTHKPH